MTESLKLTGDYTLKASDVKNGKVLVGGWKGTYTLTIPSHLQDVEIENVGNGTLIIDAPHILFELEDGSVPEFV